MIIITVKPQFRTVMKLIFVEQTEPHCTLTQDIDSSGDEGEEESGSGSGDDYDDGSGSGDDTVTQRAEFVMSSAVDNTAVDIVVEEVAGSSIFLSDTFTTSNKALFKSRFSLQHA